MIRTPNLSQQRRPDPRRQWQGRVSRAQGLHLESLIEQSCGYYGMTGVAKIEKTPEPFHIIKSIGQGRFVGNFLKAAQPDFKGTLNGGRAVVFDAKSTQTDRIGQDEVTEQQWKDLDDHQAMGALCFILVSIRMQYFFVVPWAEWREIKQRYGRKYITLEELRQYEKPFDGMKIKFL
jgi:recombination protein U